MFVFWFEKFEDSGVCKYTVVLCSWNQLVGFIQSCACAFQTPPPSPLPTVARVADTPRCNIWTYRQRKPISPESDRSPHDVLITDHRPSQLTQRHVIGQGLKQDLQEKHSSVGPSLHMRVYFKINNIWGFLAVSAAFFLSRNPLP